MLQLISFRRDSCSITSPLVVSVERREGVGAPQPVGWATGSAQPPPALHGPEPEPQRPTAVVTAGSQVSASPARLPHHGQSLPPAFLLQLLQPLPRRQQDEPQPLSQQPDPTAVQIRRGTEGGREKREGAVAQCTRGGHETQRDTVTFTCIGDEHSGVVTLFLKREREKKKKKKKGGKHKQIPQTGVFYTWQLRGESRR